MTSSLGTIDATNRTVGEVQTLQIPAILDGVVLRFSNYSGVADSCDQEGYKKYKMHENV